MKIPAVFFALLLACFEASVEIVAGPLTNSLNGHVYYLLAPINWTAMEVEAVLLEGHLATIRNTNENAWVLSSFSPFYGTSHLFIGLSDHAQEGAFRWVSGETNGYRNWAAGEPNNSNGNEDYVELKPQDGRWNDVAGLGDHYGVVEILARQTNGAPTVTIARAGNGTSVEIGWLSASNQLYQVLFAPALDQTRWSSFGTYFYGDDAMIYLLDPINQSQRFYRVVPVR